MDGNKISNFRQKLSEISQNNIVKTILVIFLTSLIFLAGITIGLTRGHFNRSSCPFSNDGRHKFQDNREFERGEQPRGEMRRQPMGRSLQNVNNNNQIPTESIPAEQNVPVTSSSTNTISPEAPSTN